ncbi:alpha/beta hydrolase [Phocaeicola sp.]
MKRKKLIIGTGITLVLLIAILLGGSQYMLNYSLRPENRGRDITGSWQYMFETYPYLKPWADSLQQAKALKDTFIYAPDEVKLHAYYVAAAQPTSKTAVIVHGYTDNAIRMMMIGYMYSRKLGFNILLPDLRDTGLSEGDAIQMGWLDRKDVMQWMGVANEIYGDSTQMVVHGISMGAATTMMISGEPQQSYVKCFVEDCGYTSVWEQFSKELQEQFGIPQFPLMYTADWLCKLEYGWGFKEASTLKQVAKCHLPMLFIHGDKDDYVPTRMVYKLYEAKPEPKELWVVPGADHAHSYLLNTEAYTEKVKQFVDKYIR